MSTSNIKNRSQNKLKDKEMSLDNNSGEATIIAFYENPHAFYYTNCQQIWSGSGLVMSLESHLQQYCSADRQVTLLVAGQFVIVRFLPLKRHKLLRGRICVRCDDGKYLVWAVDYGFPIICRAEDLWLLPPNLLENYIQFKWGCMANVMPLNGTKWSKLSFDLFHSLWKDVNLLHFREFTNNDPATLTPFNEQCSFGQLLFKYLKSDKDFTDVGCYLVEKNCARWQIMKKAANMAISSRYACHMELAAFNHANYSLKRPYQAVMNFVESCSVSLLMRNLNLDSTKPQPSSTEGNNVAEQKSKKTDSLFNNRFHKFGALTRSLTCPSEQPVGKLETLLQTRKTLQIPTSAMRLSKVENGNKGVVETGLRRSSGISSTHFGGSSSSSSESFDASDDQSQIITQKIPLHEGRPITNRRNLLEMYKKPMIPPKINRKKTAKLDSNPGLPILMEENAKIEKKPDEISPTKLIPSATLQEQKTMRQQIDNQLKQEDLHNKLERIQDNEFKKEPEIHPVNKNNVAILEKGDLQIQETLIEHAVNKFKKSFRENSVKQLEGNSNEGVKSDKVVSKIKKQPPSKNKPAPAMENRNLQEKKSMQSQSIKASDAKREVHQIKKQPEIHAGDTNPGGSLLKHNKTLGFKKNTEQVNDSSKNGPATPIINNISNHTNVNVPAEITTNNTAYISDILLAHSRTPVTPMHAVPESLFGEDIMKYMMKMKLLNATPTQLYVWPHLMRGNSLMLINCFESERSMCYLPALCCQVMRDMRTGSVAGIGPLAVLLTDTAINSDRLFNQCNEMMAAYETNMVKVLNSHAHSMDDVHSMLLNSCGILVTTVTHLRALLLHGLQLINSQRFRYFILDEYDGIRSRVPDLLSEVLQLTEKFRIPQRIFIARQWNGRVFLDVLKRFGGNPLIIFSDFLEAALYGGINLSGTVVSKENKTQQLLDYLALQKPRNKRTVIYCHDFQELDILRNELKLAGYDCISPKHAVNQQRHQLLLLLDGNQLAIQNYELLVHYSLPKVWDKFTYRFRAISDNIANYLDPSKPKCDIVSYIMLDQENQRELCRLVHFFRAHNIALDKNIKQLYANCQKLTEHSRPFCRNILRTGDCSSYLCNRRHYPVSDEIQLPTCAMWQPGTVVHCNLLKIYDPVHFAFLPLKYKCKDSNSWQDAKNLSALRKLSTSLYMHMVCAENRRIKQDLKVSDICVLRRGTTYQRVRVVDMFHERDFTVQQMDEGTDLLYARRSDLLECDARFTVEPALAMNVRLCGLAPSTAEAGWHTEATKLVKDMLNGRNENQQLEFTIEFAMFDIIYVKEIAVVQDCPTMRTCVKMAQLQVELMLQNFAKPDVQSMQKLGKLHEHVVEEQEKLLKKDVSQEEKTALVELPGNPENTNKLGSEKDDKQNELNPMIKFDESKICQLFGVLKRYLIEKNASKKAGNQLEQRKETDKETIDTDKDKELEEMIINDVSVETFLNAILKDLYSDDTTVQQETQKMLEEFLKNDEEPSPAKITTTIKTTENSEPEPQINLNGLYCGVIAGNAVRPKVRWHQTELQIELIFEQQVPQYELMHQGNVLIYQVTETKPPQRCILNLLGEVVILSERQHGYQLHVKLAKQGLTVFWPTLLNSLHSQQHSHWLVYDTERAQPQQNPVGLIHWTRYQRNPYAEEDNEDNGSLHSSDELNDVLSEGLILESDDTI